MNKLVRELEQLIARCDAQRATLADLAQHLQGPLKIADRAVACINYLRKHPALVGVAVALMVVVQQRGLWNWVRRGFMLWRAYRTLGISKFRLDV